MGPEGRGRSPLLGRVNEVLKGTSGFGRGRRSGRGYPARGRVSEPREGWRTAGGVTPEI